MVTDMDPAPSPAPARAIPLFSPRICGNEWKYVKECLDTAWVSSVGSYVDRFERLLAERVGVKYAVATSNGTAALHMALLATGIQPDDEVLVSTLTFIASANAIRYAGAWPVFVDVGPRHWQMDCNLVEEFLTKRCEGRDGQLINRTTGRRVRAIMPVHVLGHAVDLDPILELASHYELTVVEDAAEALGVLYKNRPAGGLAHAGCLSFNGNKLITTGGGGVVLTNDSQIAHTARHLTTQAKSDPIEYIHDHVGYNYRLTNVAAAIGCAQLEQLDHFIDLKRCRAADYATRLAAVPGVPFFQASPDVFCTYWMNTIQVDRKQYGLDSRELLKSLQRSGIQTRPLWQPMHISPAHRNCEAVLTGVAEQVYRDALNLPSSVDLSPEDVAFVCGTIAELGARSRMRRAA